MKRTGNSILNKAKYSNNTDEWYTDYKIIEKEVIHYEVDKLLPVNHLAESKSKNIFSNIKQRNEKIMQ